MFPTEVIDRLMLRIRHDVQPDRSQKIAAIEEVRANFERTAIEIDRLVSFAPLNKIDSLLAAVVALLRQAAADENLGRGGMWRTSRRCIELLAMVNALSTED